MLQSPCKHNLRKFTIVLQQHDTEFRRQFNRQYNRQFNRQFNYKKKRISPIPLLEIFRCVLISFRKRANTIVTGRYVGSTFVEHQRQFVEHSQYGKHISKMLHIQNWQKNVTGSQNTFVGVWNLKNMETRFHFLQKHENMLKLITKIMCRMDQTLFQASSWGSELKQNRFGGKFRNTVKKTVII